MNNRIFATVLCLGLAGFAAVSEAQANPWNKRTILTVHESIQVPGAVLEPGKYVMKLHNSMANRNIVQIFNEREDLLVTTILALPHYRMQPTDKTEFRFWEVPAGEARALRAWFYPGDHHGQEFVYPKGFAVQLAKQNHMNVPMLHDEAKTSAELAKVEVDSLNEAGVQEPLDLTAYEKLELSANPVEVALATPPIEAVAETAAETHSSIAGHESLPETSSPAAAVGLAGLLSLAAGAGLRALSRRSA